MPPPAATVFVVDDNPATAEPLSSYLEGCGYAVRVVGTAVDAATALADWTPDAAVIDVDAADRGGLAAAEDLAARDRRPLLIALLRPEMAATVARETLALFDDVFTKAASPAVIAERIARHLARRTVRLEGDRPG